MPLKEEVYVRIPASWDCFSGIGAPGAHQRRGLRKDSCFQVLFFLELEVLVPFKEEVYVRIPASWGCFSGIGIPGPFKEEVYVRIPASWRVFSGAASPGPFKEEVYVRIPASWGCFSGIGALGALQRRGLRKDSCFLARFFFWSWRPWCPSKKRST